MARERETMQETAQKQSTIKMSGIYKHFAGVQALNDVSLELFPGEILALIGENGAGKSTLMRILMGIEKKDAGTVCLNGAEINPETPMEAEQCGIGMVFQEQALFPNLSVAENLFLGREGEMVTANFLHWKKMYQESEMILNEVHLSHIDPRTRLERLSFSERQMVELARVLYPAVRSKRKGIIILDEPTAVLSPSEVEQLFKVVSSLREHASFVFISHHLDEVIRYTDRVEVMKDGQNVGGLMTKDATIQKLQEMMVGREFSRDFYYAKDMRTPEETVVLELDKVSSDVITDVSLKLKKGEILGIAGLMGCGKENLAKVIFGDEPITAGTITVGGRKIQGSIKKAVEAGIGYMPSDRRSEGILDTMTVGQNITVANMDHFVSGAFLDRTKENACVNEYIDRLKIKTPSGNTLIVNLSGGNQQKAILARWLSRKPDIIIMEQPTRGIDVGAKQEIYRIMRDLANEGVSILVISDEMPELIGLSNRIIMMRKGAVTGEIDCKKEAKLNEKHIIQYIT